MPQPPLRVEGQHGIVADIDDDDISVPVDCDAVGPGQRFTFDKDRNLPVGVNLVDPFRRACVRYKNAAVVADADAIQEIGLGHREHAAREAGLEIEGADYVDIGRIQEPVPDRAP